MSTTLSFSGLPSGLTLTCTIYPRASDTATQSSVSLTEATNAKTVYTGTFTIPSNGFYRFLIYIGSVVLASGVIYAETSGTFYDDEFGAGTELAAVPNAVTHPFDALQFLYQALRNQTAEIAGQITLSNNAGSVVATAAITEDGTTLTKGKYA